MFFATSAVITSEVLHCVPHIDQGKNLFTLIFNIANYLSLKASAHLVHRYKAHNYQRKRKSTKLSSQRTMTDIHDAACNPTFNTEVRNRCMRRSIKAAAPFLFAKSRHLPSLMQGKVTTFERSDSWQTYCICDLLIYPDPTNTDADESLHSVRALVVVAYQIYDIKRSHCAARWPCSVAYAENFHGGLSFSGIG